MLEAKNRRTYNVRLFSIMYFKKKLLQAKKKNKN